MPEAMVSAPAQVDVAVVGAGPAGLMLACELGLRKVRTVVLERDPAPPGHCRGFNLNARSLELLDRRGLADRFLAEGPTVPSTVFVGAAQLDLAAMRTGHPYVLGIAQTRVAEILAERAVELGVRILRGHRLAGLRQDDGGVCAEVDSPDGRTLLRPGGWSAATEAAARCASWRASASPARPRTASRCSGTWSWRTRRRSRSE